MLDNSSFLAPLLIIIAQSLILKFGIEDFTDPGLLKIRLTFAGLSMWFCLQKCFLHRNDTLIREGDLYITANDPRLQMIPKMDRKWSSTINEPQCRPEMIPNGKLEWLGLKLLDHCVLFIITTKSIERNKFGFTDNCKKSNCKLRLKLCSINETQINANEK